MLPAANVKVSALEMFLVKLKKVVDPEMIWFVPVNETDPSLCVKLPPLLVKLPPTCRSVGATNPPPNKLKLPATVTDPVLVKVSLESV